MNIESKNSKFSIIKAAIDGWRFIGKNFAYLLKIGLMPLTVHLACNFFVLYVRPESSTLEAFLWGLPATIFMAWYSFIVVRLIIFGERLETVAKDPIAKDMREHALRASVLLAVLFNMGITASAAGLEMIVRSGMVETGNVVMMGLAVFSLVITLWSFRFGVLPLLAAVDYPLAPFLKQIQGFEFSLRLLGLGLLSLFPMIIVSEILFAPLIDNPLQPTESDALIMILISSPMSLMMVTILTAVITFALKEMLERDARIL